MVSGDDMTKNSLNVDQTAARMNKSSVVVVLHKMWYDYRQRYDAKCVNFERCTIVKTCVSNLKVPACLMDF